jgi:hypothetical protein
MIVDEAALPILALFQALQATAILAGLAVVLDVVEMGPSGALALGAHL